LTQKYQFWAFVQQSVDKKTIILDYSNNTEVAAMALGVVSSNPPPLVDILPDSHESGIFLPGLPQPRALQGSVVFD
jgi:hypothetical protein